MLLVSKLQLELSNKHVLHRLDLGIVYTLGTGRSRAAVKANRLVRARTYNIEAGSLINAPVCSHVQHEACRGLRRKLEDIDVAIFAGHVRLVRLCLPNG